MVAAFAAICTLRASAGPSPDAARVEIISGFTKRRTNVALQQRIYLLNVYFPYIARTSYPNLDLLPNLLYSTTNKLHSRNGSSHYVFLVSRWKMRRNGGCDTRQNEGHGGNASDFGKDIYYRFFHVGCKRCLIFLNKQNQSRESRYTLLEVHI